MKKIAKAVFILLGVAAVAGISFYYATQPLVFDLYQVKPTEASLYFIEQGFVKDSETVTVYPVVSGALVSVSVSEGQTVRKGDPLCAVDATALRFQIAQAQSEIDGYNAQIGNLDLEEKRQKDTLIFNKENIQAEYDALSAQEDTASVSKEDQIRVQNILIDQSRADLTVAREKLEEGRILYENNILPKSAYDDLAAAVTSVESTLETNLSNLDRTKTGEAQTSAAYFESMKAALLARMKEIDYTMAQSYTGAMKKYYVALIDRAAVSVDMLNKQIADCTVLSPVDGQITTLSVQNANTVSVQTPVAVITTEKSDEIETAVATADIGAVAVNDSVELTANRTGQDDVVFQGTVVAIDDKATVSLSALGVEERKVKVTVKPTVPEGLTLNPGYDIDVKFITYEAAEQLTVPKTATYQKDGQDMVWLVKDGAATEAPVTLGTALRAEHVVLSGLLDGDLVIKDVNQEGLKPGVKIKGIDD